MPYTDSSGVQVPTGTDAFSPTSQFKTWQDKNATYNNRVVVALDTQRTALAAPVLRDGLQCYVTGTKKTWIYQGSTWVDSSSADTGWVSITTFLNGWTAVEAVSYRVLNGVVFWRGSLTGGSSADMLNIPSGARPLATGPAALSWSVNLRGTTTSGRVTGGTAGTTLAGTSGGQPILTGISYPADA